jgi:SpoIID/LytB domain protein
MAVVAALGAAAGAAGAPAVAGASGPSTLTLTGHGYGHGHGMGQWGALGYAIAQTPYQSIVSHFYGGTGLSPLSPSQASTQLRVALSENDGNSVIVTSDTPFTVVGVPNTTFDAVLMQLNSDGTDWTVSGGTSCAGPWSAPFSTSWTDPTAVPVTDPALGDPNAATEALQLCQVGGNLTVRGDITGTQFNGSSRTVNTLPLEQYVAAVVPNESPSGWGTLGGAGPQGQAWGFQELEAQAVAVRSYAMATLDSYPPVADTCDLSCQTYRGLANESSIADAAASDTAGQVMELPGGAVAPTQYSASTGGYTNPGGTSPGFPAVPDTGDSICIPGACNPNHDWTASVPASSIVAAWPQLGTFEGVEVTARNGYGDWGGRVTELTVVGSSQSVPLTGDQFAIALGLKSDWFIPTDQVPTSVVGMATTDDGQGYWMVGSNGGMDSFGDAVSYGSAGDLTLNHPIVGMASTPDGKGYWLVASDGGVFSYGDAAFFGSTGSLVLNRPVVGMASTPDGKGYWLVAADGGIFSFGDAAFYGSTGSMHLNQPVVGMAATDDGGGYWLVAADGGIFSFGDAAFHGSTGSMHLNQAVVGMSTSPDGGGYRLVAADGGIFSFGDAAFYGSTGSLTLNRPVVSMATSHDGGGYWLVAADGGVFAFGDAFFFGSPVG